MLGYDESNGTCHFQAQLEGILDRMPGDIGAFETIVFMFDLIVNADNRERTIKSFHKMIDFFQNMIKKEKENAKPVLLSHVLTALLEASDQQEE